MQSGLSSPSFCSRVSFVSWDILPCLVFHVLAAGPLANFRCDVPGSARLLAGRATTGRARENGGGCSGVSGGQVQVLVALGR